MYVYLHIILHHIAYSILMLVYVFLWLFHVATWKITISKKTVNHHGYHLFSGAKASMAMLNKKYFTHL